MARRWTSEEEQLRRNELEKLYLKENLPLREVACILKISETAAYDRLKRLGIPIIRERKTGYNNTRRDITIPDQYSPHLAEFVGILLGDGGLTNTQVTVTINEDEGQYINYVSQLIQKVFKITPRIIPRKGVKARCIYFGSAQAVQYFLNMGLVSNKVKEQVGIPKWVMEKKIYQASCLRGLIDTDGSVYKLKFGVQLSFTSRSKQLLIGVKRILENLEFHPSRISSDRIYLTKRPDLIRHYRQIGFANHKHRQRFERFLKARVGEVVKPSGL